MNMNLNEFVPFEGGKMRFTCDKKPYVAEILEVSVTPPKVGIVFGNPQPIGHKTAYPSSKRLFLFELGKRIVVSDGLRLVIELPFPELFTWDPEIVLDSKAA